MPKVESLGIQKLEAIHWYVKDLDRSRRFYTENVDFAEVARSSPEREAQGKQTSAVFEAGTIRVIVSAPKGAGGAAAHWLQHHPAGVGTLVFTVEDIDKTFRLLDARGGTPTDAIKTITDARGGRFRTFAITTPFGSTLFRFVQREGGYHDLYPELERAAKPFAGGGGNKFGFDAFDHVTSNFETMSPALLWMEHVCGFERYWNIEFHTNDVRIDDKNGSGLRSIVMWDPTSGCKFANNEPYRPFFRASQIHLFCEDNRGDGVQHVAWTVRDILGAVRGLRTSGVQFMPTAGPYYDALPERLTKMGVGSIDEDIAVLRDLQILVDGSESHKYMLQIFLREAAGLYGDKDAGPFFYEIIQRKGDRGFGGGNFRALFESIERQQKTEGRL